MSYSDFSSIIVSNEETKAFILLAWTVMSSGLMIIGK